MRHLRRIWCALFGHAWQPWHRVMDGEWVQHYYRICGQCRYSWFQIQKPH